MAKFLLESIDIAHRNKVTAMIVEALTSTVAKELAAAQFDSDDDWANADVTDLSSDFVADLEGWTYRVKVGNALKDGTPAYDVSFVGVSGATADTIGAGLKAALIAAGIASADYNTGSNLLTVAASGANLGKRTIEVDIYPPGGVIPVNSLRTTLVHNAGSDATILSCVLVQPTKIPAIKKTL